jgi:predicted RNA binding protein YcfA (HicA-like mRNA interferase family)
VTDPPLPPVSGFQLIKLLVKDGWIAGRYSLHGLCLKKQVGDRWLVTFVPPTRAIIPEGTLGAILGSKQTRLTKKGLGVLIEKYGLPKNSPLK